ncbi:hypothetical protein ACQUW5_09375 [Legionella sp. CNM-1927-20]|uniref:hypothetical protein n=1 Tax=Legionella sp. CNM-1927-20 TaxID=3422221 RepID=UPI00403B0AFC
MSDYLRAPNKEAILKALEVASLTPEAANYLCKRLSETLSQVNIAASDEVIKRVDRFGKNIELRYGQRSDPWQGRPDVIKTDFQNAQHNMGISLLEELSPESLASGNLHMDFAISDDAQLLRAFSLNGEPLDPEAATAIDTLFNGWLAENEMVSKDSVIYESDSDGRIKENKNGQSTKANAERVKQLIVDRDNGFAPYLDDKFKNHTTHEVTASVQQHAYPEQPRVVEQPVEPVSTTQTPETRTPEPTPTAAEAPATVEPETPEITNPTTPT